MSTPLEQMVREAILKIREKELELSAMTEVPVSDAKEVEARQRIEELTKLLIDAAAPTMSNEELRVLMDLTMGSYPWPLTDKALKVVQQVLNREARRRYHDSWITAYHAMEPKEV